LTLQLAETRQLLLSFDSRATCFSSAQTRMKNTPPRIEREIFTKPDPADVAPG